MYAVAVLIGVSPWGPGPSPVRVGGEREKVKPVPEQPSPWKEGRLGVGCD